MEPQIEPRSRTNNDVVSALARRLKRFHGKNPLVLACSSSAVDLAKKLAHELQGHCDKLLVKKLLDPKDPGCILGAVNEEGGVFLNRESARRGYTLENLAEEIHALVEQMQHYRRHHPMTVTPTDHATIFVDVGSTAGHRLMAALQIVKTYPPAMCVIATPEITHRAFALVNNLVDELVALKVTSTR